MSQPSTYQFQLPDTCIGFTSSEGKEIFRESLNSGYANVYFQLSEQFKTQHHPRTCGFATIVIALNALRVDPKRIWKMTYRWYNERMVACCVNFDDVEGQGMTLEQFANTAVCNNLDINIVRMGHKSADLNEFRELVKDICAGDGRILACNYTREILQKAGGGHFSPIAAYHPEKDLVLILDTSRYKYETHWAKLSLLWEAMQPVDSDTEKPRGYTVLQKIREVQPSLLFGLSCSFRLAISSRSVMYTPMSDVLFSWETTVKMIEDCSKSSKSSEDQKTGMFAALNKSLESLVQSESFFTVKVDEEDDTPNRFEDHTTKLAQAIESIAIFGDIEEMSIVSEKDRNSNLVGDVTEKQSIQHSQLFKCSNVQQGSSLASLELKRSHLITMLLLSWPYQHEEMCGKKCLVYFIENIIANAPDILQNEITCLQQRIKSLISLRKHYKN